MAKEKTMKTVAFYCFLEAYSGGGGRKVEGFSIEYR
jgi:hypothetical protein